MPAGSATSRPAETPWRPARARTVCAAAHRPCKPCVSPGFRTSLEPQTESGPTLAHHAARWGLPDVRISSRRSIAAFYALALGISWSLWAPWVASARAGGLDVSWRYLHLVGSLGPCSYGALPSSAGQVDVRTCERSPAARTAPAVRVALVWSILFPTIAFVASVLTMALMNGTPVRWDCIGVVGEYPGLNRIEYIAASFLFYGIGEEVGWRGFLYPALRRPQRRMLTAALLVVPFWAFWPTFARSSSRPKAIGRWGSRRRGRLAACLPAGERERHSPPGSPIARRDWCCQRLSFTPSWTSSSSPTSASRFNRRWERS